MNCTQCGAEIVPGAAFCPECGARTPSQSTPTARISSAGQETVFLPESQMQQPMMTPPPAPLYTPPGVNQPQQPPPLSPPPIPGVPNAPVYSPPQQAAPLQPYMPPPPPAPTAYQYTGTTAASPPNSTAAVVSLVTGICAWVILPFICAIVAVVAGHIGLKEVRESDGRLGGRGMAIAGLILGYTQIGLSVLFCVFFAFIALIAGAS